jgi:hypothetical protein
MMDGTQLGLLESLDKCIRSLLKPQGTKKDLHEEMADTKKELCEELELKTLDS